jgi:peptidoglycan/LPS O-acetylase OafA/YrhL
VTTNRSETSLAEATVDQPRLDTLVPPPPETDAEFPVLDALRAVGALAVLTTHVTFWSGAYTGNGTWGVLMARMDIGVAIFFVLSGFLLARPYLLRAAADQPAPGTGRYFWKRFLRIYPVYLITAILAMSFIGTNQDAGLGTWVRTLLMLDTYADAGFPAGLTHMWSLAVEVSFYLVLPALMLVATGRGRRRGFHPQRVVALAVAMYAVMLWWRVDGADRMSQLSSAAVTEWLPSYLGWFAVGLALAAAQVCHARGSGSRTVALMVRLARQPGVCWVLAGGLLLIAATPIAGPTMLAPPTTSEVVTKQALYAAIGGLLVLTGIYAVPGTTYHRVFTASASRRLGWISYSIFCLHLPVLHFVMWATGWKLFAGHGPAIWLLTAVLTVIVADLSYRLVERPALRLKAIRLRRPDVARR